MFGKILGMKKKQVENEIIVMREFDKAVKEIVSLETYLKITTLMSRRLMEKWLKETGTSDEEIKNMLDEVDETFKMKSYNPVGGDHNG